MLSAVSEPNFERRLDEICEGLQPYTKRHLLEKVSQENASTIIEYINALKTETHLSISYKQTAIDTLTTLAKFHNDNGSKSFKNMSRNDILARLNDIRKSEEQDPKHKWIGTYETNRINITRFFKWLYYPLMDAKQRPEPEQVQNIPQIPRKEESNYEAHELWLDADYHRIFLKYCPSVRDRAFHVMMLDTSCRPKELMSAKIGDVMFIDEGYNQKHAIIRVVGKSGRSIRKMLYKSLPYLKDWLSAGNHPMPNNSQAYLFCGVGRRNKGRKLERHHFSHTYSHYKKYFQSLLNSPDLPAEDKKIIKEKMLTKPWRPYMLRHASLTEKAATGMLNEYQLRDHADWTITSNMARKYLHFRGDESIKALQQAHGIVPIGKEHNNIKQQDQGILAPTITCYNCKEPNKTGSRICSNPNCKMILSFEAYMEKQQELEQYKNKVSTIEQTLKKMLLYEWDASGINLEHPDEIEHESLEETLKRVNISNRRLPSSFE